MKRLIFIIITFTFLSSCSANYETSDGFIHASGLDETENGVRFSVLIEKQDGNDNDYSCVSYDGKTLKEAFDKFRAEYPSCYTGSAQLCFFGETLSRRSLYECALFITENPVFPSKSRAVSVSSVTTTAFLQGIETHDDLKQIKNMCYNESPNIVAFFALSTNQNSTAKLCSFTLKDNKPTQLMPVYYRNCAIIMSHYLNKNTKG